MRSADGKERVQAAPRSLAAGRLGFVEPSERIRRIAARNLVATLFAVASITIIPWSGDAQDRSDLPAQDRLRALVDEALGRSPDVFAAQRHWQAKTKGPIPQT